MSEHGLVFGPLNLISTQNHKMLSEILAYPANTIDKYVSQYSQYVSLWGMFSSMFSSMGILPCMNHVLTIILINMCINYDKMILNLNHDQRVWPESPESDWHWFD